jgi:hypothetical protein
MGQQNCTIIPVIQWQLYYKYEKTFRDALQQSHNASIKMTHLAAPVVAIFFFDVNKIYLMLYLFANQARHEITENTEAALGDDMHVQTQAGAPLPHTKLTAENRFEIYVLYKKEDVSYPPMSVIEKKASGL